MAKTRRQKMRQHAHGWCREYFTTQADYEPVGSTTLYIPPRKLIREVYDKYVEKVEWDDYNKPLGERQFARVFNEMIKKPFTCPITHREMQVKIRTQRARGFKICSACEDYRLLLWNAKNRDEKERYKCLSGIWIGVPTP